MRLRWALAESRDGDAKRHLLALGRQPALEASGRFLRGLLQWYSGRDAEAEATWAGLDAESPLAQVAHRHLMRTDSGAGGWATVVAALRERKPNEALRALASAWPGMPGDLRLLFARDLPGALAHLDLSLESAVERLGRAVPESRRMVPDSALLASALASSKLLDGSNASRLLVRRAVNAWLSAEERGAIAHRAGTRFLEASAVPFERGCPHPLLPQGRAAQKSPCIAGSLPLTRPTTAREA